MKAPLLITIPHSGEQVPKEVNWLKGIKGKTLLLDIDRFVDVIYAPVLRSHEIVSVIAKVNRSAVDLNRYPDDVDVDSVQGSPNPSGSFPSGFHWVRNSRGDVLIKKPMKMELHQKLVKKYHDAFHRRIEEAAKKIKKKFPRSPLYHLDCHSMPPYGTAAHADQGRSRAEVVVSDFNGKSASPEFRDFIFGAFQKQGFEVALNWPYQGGRITQRYGKPAERWHTIQIELNRKLYLDEATRKKLPEFKAFSKRVCAAIERIAAFTLG